MRMRSEEGARKERNIFRIVMRRHCGICTHSLWVESQLEPPAAPTPAPAHFTCRQVSVWSRSSSQTYMSSSARTRLLVGRYWVDPAVGKRLTYWLAGGSRPNRHLFFSRALGHGVLSLRVERSIASFCFWYLSVRGRRPMAFASLARGRGSAGPEAARAEALTPQKINTQQGTHETARVQPLT